MCTLHIWISASTLKACRTVYISACAFGGKEGWQGKHMAVQYAHENVDNCEGPLTSSVPLPAIGNGLIQTTLNRWVAKQLGTSKSIGCRLTDQTGQLEQWLWSCFRRRQSWRCRSASTALPAWSTVHMWVLSMGEFSIVFPYQIVKDTVLTEQLDNVSAHFWAWNVSSSPSGQPQLFQVYLIHLAHVWTGLSWRLNSSASFEEVKEMHQGCPLT